MIDFAHANFLKTRKNSCALIGKRKRSEKKFWKTKCDP